VNLFLRIKRYSPGPAAYLLGAVFLLRMFALGRLTASPFLLPARGDMHFYNDWAQRILHGQLTDHLAFYGLPGYAWLLAFLYKLFGYTPFVPAFLQGLLDSGTAVLIYKFVVRLLTSDTVTPPAGNCASLPRPTARTAQWIGLAAGLGWGLCLPAQAYSVILMPTAWLIFIFWFVVWQIVENERALSPSRGLILGLLVGIVATGIATILFLVPLLMAAFFRGIPGEIKASPRHWPKGIALLLLGIMVGTSPCWVHNYFIARDPVFLSAHSGINFWIGNNPEANGYPRFPPGLRAGQAAMLQDSIAKAEAAADHPLKHSAVSEYWSSKARSYIAENPVAWARLLLLKFRNFWSAFRYDDLSIVTSLREEGVILPGLEFGLIAALAIPGMLLAFSRLPLSRWILAAILLHMAALLPVFVTERYRLPVVPGLLVFAAIGLWFLWANLALGRVRPVMAYVLILFLSAVFVSWPQTNPSLWALDAYNSGWQALEAADLPNAERKLSRALAYVPDNAETNFAFGNLRLAQGNRAAAIAFYETALRLDPNHGSAMNNLGIVAFDDGRLADAANWFQRAAVANPRYPKPHFLLARTLLAQSHPEAARREIDLAIQLDPNSPECQQLRQQIDESQHLRN
jgi:tetratricopeptide (TPR) repeat protein